MSTQTSLPATMRAQQWTSVPTRLSAALRFINDAITPSARHLTSNSVLVRVSYTSLNPVDYKLPEVPVVGRFAISKPASPCSDFCGTVVATGPGRSDLSPGQWVFGQIEPPKYGACAEYITVTSKEACVAMPEGVKPEEAGTIGIAALTAYQCIVPKLPSSKRDGSKINVFINGGSGGTGTFGIQFAKAKGCRVVTTCSARNVDLCRSLGADEVIDYTKQDVVASLVESAKAHGPFDLVVDNVGGATPLYWQAHRYLVPNANYVAVGGGASLQGLLDFGKMFLWPGVLGGGRHKYEFLTCTANAKQYADIAAMMAQGKVKPVIEEIYSLEEVPRAFERMYTGRVSGKLVVKVSE